MDRRVCYAVAVFRRAVTPGLMAMNGGVVGAFVGHPRSLPLKVDTLVETRSSPNIALVFMLRHVRNPRLDSGQMCSP
jgi:hypothetical protein